MPENTIIDFLSELISNNNREWFNTHKDRYVLAWNQFNELLEQLIAEIAKFDPSISYLTPKDCTYRIYRDIRFSADKTPYKGHFGAFINEAGKKAWYGGYYIQIEPHRVLLGSGVWWLPTKEMHALRHAIVDQVDTYRAIVEAPEFKALHPTIGLNFYKRIPNGYPKDFPYPEYLLCKDYTCCCEVQPNLLLQDDAARQIAKIFHTMKPFNDFLKENILINLEEMEGMKDVVKFF